MDANGIRDVLSKITYKKGWYFIYVESVTSSNLGYIQIECSSGVDSVTGKPCVWKSRKHALSNHLCKQEVVGAVFSLIKDAEMHEMHEWFRYKEASIFNPHLDPDALAELASKKSNFIVRSDSMTET